MTDIEAQSASDSTVRRPVFWLGVIALLFALGCALGVLFGVLYYNYESAQPPSRVQAKAVRLVLIGIVEKGVLMLAFGYLCRSLLRYANALKRRTDEETLAALQSACWQAAIWLALLYAGWELTAALVGAMW